MSLKAPSLVVSLAFISIIIIGLSAFYWFAYRPVMFRKICHQETEKYYSPARYEKCLHKYGY